VQFHMRPAGDDLDLAIRLAGLLIDEAIDSDVPLPPFDGLVDFQFAGGAASEELLPLTLRGRSGILRNATINIAGSEAGANVHGPVSVDEQGLVDATLELTLRDPRAFATVFS